MNTEITDINAGVGLILYDGDCPLCVSWAHRFEPILRQAGFALTPLPSAGGGTGFTEMVVLTPDGRRFGGADGLVQIARRVWWAWPLFGFAQLPGSLPLLRAGYRRLAANRQCLGGVCKTRHPKLAHHRHGAFFEMP